MFLLVPAYPGCPGSKAVKRSLLLLLLLGAVKRLILHWCTKFFKDRLNGYRDVAIFVIIKMAAADVFTCSKFCGDWSRAVD